jgi:hypothetical protein
MIHLQAEPIVACAVGHGFKVEAQPIRCYDRICRRWVQCPANQIEDDLSANSSIQQNLAAYGLHQLQAMRSGSAENGDKLAVAAGCALQSTLDLRKTRG